MGVAKLLPTVVHDPPGEGKGVKDERVLICEAEADDESTQACQIDFPLLVVGRVSGLNGQMMITPGDGGGSCEVGRMEGKRGDAREEGRCERGEGGGKAERT